MRLHITAAQHRLYRAVHELTEAPRGLCVDYGRPHGRAWQGTEQQQQGAHPPTWRETQSMRRDLHGPLPLLGDCALGGHGGVRTNRDVDADAWSSGHGV